MTGLAADRALALAALRPRQATPPAYDQLTDSGRAEVDRIVALIREVRAEALADAATEWAYLTEGSGPVVRFLRARAARDVREQAFQAGYDAARANRDEDPT